MSVRKVKKASLRSGASGATLSLGPELAADLCDGSAGKACQFLEGDRDVRLLLDELAGFCSPGRDRERRLLLCGIVREVAQAICLVSVCVGDPVNLTQGTNSLLAVTLLTGGLEGASVAAPVIAALAPRGRRTAAK